MSTAGGWLAGERLPEGDSLPFMRLTAALLCCAALAAAADEGEALDRPPPPRPGQEAPAAEAAPCLVRFDWDTYRTVVVVGEGVGLVKPAWVVTWEDGKLQVGYRASAFRDARGRLHIDARKSRDVGPNSEAWSPDSFAFGHRTLWTVDDRGSAHSSEFPGVVPAAQAKADYQAELQKAQALIEGGS